MYTQTVLTTNTDVTTVGDQKSSDSRDYQKGTCTVEVTAGVSNGQDPIVKIYGKLIESDDASVDSGWFELAEYTTAAANDVSGFPVDILPHMSATVTQNGSDLKNIKVAIGYNKYA